MDGKTVIEYPTIFFGSFENTKKLSMKVVEIQSNYENEISQEKIEIIEDNILKDKINITSTLSISSSPSSLVPLDDITNKKRNFNDFEIVYKNEIKDVNNEISKKVAIESIDDEVNYKSDDDDNENKNDNNKQRKIHKEKIGIREKKQEQDEQPEEQEECVIEKKKKNDNSEVMYKEEDEEEGEEEKERNDEENEEEEDEEDEDEEDGEEIFLTALKEFESKDIEALKAFISSSEM